MDYYKLIPLTRGLFAKVDVSDYDWLNQWKWTAYSHATPGKFYAKRVDTTGGQRKLVSMHRLIVGATSGMEVDHRNDDSLDNQRFNLRECTKGQNRANIKKWGNVSVFKGVYWHTINKNWFAKIMCESKAHHLGVFDSEEEAAIQYDRAALELFKEFALLNFPEKAAETWQRPFKKVAQVTSEYRGVSWEARGGKWVAFIKTNGKTYNLGSFKDEKEAAKAYDAAAVIHRGVKAKLNFR